jgi:choline dehydrogenase
MEHDIIIVGAGSAGCVLANRLSADPTRRVCLIEAGPKDRNPLIHIPLGLALLARSRRVNWGYATEPEPALAGRRLYWPRGKTLGGSSSINAMIYMRGHPEDYRGWGRAAGPMWDWPRMRELFLRLEDNGAIADGHHGVGGPLSVQDLRAPNPLSRAFVEAAGAAGLPTLREFNGESQEGAALYQVTQRNGQRFSAARAFLEPVRGRRNIEVLTGAQVERVLFEGRRAVGVQVAGRDLRLRPGGEVVLCGGAVNSPQLLMLSGIGPGAELSRMGIAVLADRAEVGANLADHLDVTVMAKDRGRVAIGVAPAFLPRLVRAGWAYGRRREGELTSNVAEAGAFARSDAGRDRPNLQFHFLPAYLRDHGRKTSWGFGVTLHVCDLLPKSRGRIGLASPDPRAAARIEAGYLSAPEDEGVLLAGVRMARRILAAAPLAGMLAGEVSPGPQAQSDAALMDHIRRQAETIYHPVGSCRMGLDDGSVVDEAARVRGVEGLRVVDASIMPAIIAGNTNAPVMAMAENVAEMMLRRD